MKKKLAVNSYWCRYGCDAMLMLILWLLISFPIVVSHTLSLDPNLIPLLACDHFDIHTLQYFFHKFHSFFSNLTLLTWLLGHLLFIINYYGFPLWSQSPGAWEDMIFGIFYGASKAGAITWSLNHTQWIINLDNAGKHFHYNFPNII